MYIWALIQDEKVQRLKFPGYLKQEQSCFLMLQST